MHTDVLLKTEQIFMARFSEGNFETPVLTVGRAIYIKLNSCQISHLLRPAKIGEEWTKYLSQKEGQSALQVSYFR